MAAATVDRAQVQRFLESCIEMLKSETARETLKDPTSGRPGPKIVELQKQVWDDLGVSTQDGRLAVSRIKENYPDDHASLISLRDAFGRAVDAAYLQCLEDRRPTVLKTKEKMPRNTVLEFLDACNVKLDLPETRQLLQEHIEMTGAMPEPVINNLHNEVMELLGFEREHAQRCFDELGSSSEFMKDREVAMSYARWRGKTSDICLTLLNERLKAGSELNVDQNVRNKLYELKAKEELDSMTNDERVELLRNKSKKVNVFRGLPDDARERHLQKMPEADKLELVKCEILMSTLVQAQSQRFAP